MPDRISTHPRSFRQIIGLKLLATSRRASDWVCRPLVRLTANRLAPRMRVPAHFLILLMTLEDKRFLIHPGIDPIAVLRAVLAWATGVGIHQGGSTITQQLFNLDGSRRSGQRTLSWKCKQMSWAFREDRLRSKADILSAYLSSAYFGKGLYGLDKAAWGYFGSTRERLTIAQSFFLVDRLPRPSTVSVRRVSSVVRRPLISSLMEQADSLTELIEIYETHFACGAELTRRGSTRSMMRIRSSTMDARQAEA